MNDPACPDCKVAMEPGFVVDNSYGGMGQTVARPEWAEGDPAPYSMWTGMRMKGRDRYQVKTYRCPKCGYLKGYAHAES